MSPRTRRTRDCSFERRTRWRARCSIGAERSMPTSGTPARPSGRAMRPVPQPELQHRAAGLQRQVAPERHVTPAERPRVLPVVERRVVVPAFVAFGLDAGRLSRFRLPPHPTQIVVPRWQTASCSGSRRTTRRPAPPPSDRRRARPDTRARGSARRQSCACETALSTRARRAAQISSGSAPSWICGTGNSRTSIGSMPCLAKSAGNFGPMDESVVSPRASDSAAKNCAATCEARRPQGVEL